MFTTIWKSLVYTPLHNILAFIVDITPGGDVGVAVILVTILIKIVLFPLTRKSIISQIKLKNIEPAVRKIREDFPDKTIQAQKTFELYKKEKVNPFSGFLVILIQLPIIFGLFSVFRNGLSFDQGLLYPFVNIPSDVSLHFLGLFDLTKKSIFLAVLVMISQYFLAKIMNVRTQPQGGVVDPSKKVSFQDELAKNMQTQMLYVMPVMMGVFAYIGFGVIALYFLVSNLMTIAQEVYIRKTVKI